MPGACDFPRLAAALNLGMMPISVPAAISVRHDATPTRWRCSQPSDVILRLAYESVELCLTHVLPRSELLVAGQDAGYSEISRGFLQSPHKCWDSASITPRPLPSTFFPIHHTSSHHSKLYDSTTEANEHIWRSGGLAPLFFNSAPDGGVWLASGFYHFTPGTHWIGGWVGPRAGLDAAENRNILH
jgi:hypothetical protein